MKGFYQVTEIIKEALLSDVNVNTVTTGDITRIDLGKQTMFPLSHLVVNNVGNEDSVLRFSLSISNCFAASTILSALSSMCSHFC